MWYVEKKKEQKSKQRSKKYKNRPMHQLNNILGKWESECGMRTTSDGGWTSRRRMKRRKKKNRMTTSDALPCLLVWKIYHRFWMTGSTAWLVAWLLQLFNGLANPADHVGHFRVDAVFALLAAAFSKAVIGQKSFVSLFYHVSINKSLT